MNLTDPTSVVPPILTSLVRFGLTAGGSWLAQHGVVTGDQASMIGGSAVAVAGLAWSVWQKFHANTKLKAAIAAPAK